MLAAFGIALPPPELELLELEDDELELLLEELELLELEEELLLELEDELVVDPVPPLQLPAAGLIPEITMVSIFANPALLVAFKLNKLLPATKVTVAVVELVHVVQLPVPAKA